MSETDNPVIGQLRGIGLRLDPQEILIAPYEEPGSGLKWGYTILDKTKIPTMYMEDGWREIVPEGVWLQMLENWERLAEMANDTFSDYPEYLQYPEIRDLIS